MFHCGGTVVFHEYITGFDETLENFLSLGLVKINAATEPVPQSPIIESPSVPGPMANFCLGIIGSL
jgi:hypothetical protein